MGGNGAQSTVNNALYSLRLIGANSQIPRTRKRSPNEFIECFYSIDYNTCMKSFQRTQVTTIVQRLSEKPHKLIAVFGPRQTGKTTIVRQVLGQIDLESRYLAVDSPDSPVLPLPSNVSGAIMPFPQVRDTGWLVSNWREGRREANRCGRAFVLVFDEIQKIANWSETVKGLWDADRSKKLPAARRHSGLGSIAHAVGIA